MKYRVSVIVDNLDPILGSLANDLAAYGELVITTIAPPKPVRSAPIDIPSDGSIKGTILDAIATGPKTSMELRGIVEGMGRSRKAVDGAMAALRAQQKVDRLPGGKWGLKA
jgi:hypothetical protein